MKGYINKNVATPEVGIRAEQSAKPLIYHAKAVLGASTVVGSSPLALAALANHGSKLSRLNPGAVDVIRIEVNGAIWQLIALFLFATLFWIWKPWTLKKP